MRLAVSNIAWEADEDAAVLEVLRDEGVDAVEVAPTRLAADPTLLSKTEAIAIRRSFEDAGLDVVALQSLLFGRPELVLFGSDDSREELLNHLGSMIGLAGHLGATRLVFGSPRNRRLPPDADADECFDVARHFFRQVGVLADEVGVVFCIEPNPVAYGCDFVVTTDEGIRLVDAVDHPGFGLHLDVAGSALAGERITSSVHAAADRIRHFHISAPHLAPLEEDVADHISAAQALNEIGYDGVVSIEMRSGDSGSNPERVRAAVRLARSRYSAVRSAP